MKKFGFILILLFNTFMGKEVYAQTCWTRVSHHFGIDESLLKAIAWQESRGKADAIGPPLKGGNIALGIMQINTIHLPTLKKLGIKKSDLFDPCTNIKIGASILADCIRHEGAIWNAVGCYYTGPNSRNASARIYYVHSVMRHYQGYRQKFYVTQR